MIFFEEFKTQILEAQIKANESNSGVTVIFKGQVTFVEPNLPKFGRKEIQKRYERLQEEAMFEDSLSILARGDKSN